MVIWLTGISGAGKSTIANALFARVKPDLPELVLIDGDAIRELFGQGLGFQEEARWQQIGRIQRLAKFLAQQGIHVIVAALYCHPELMRWNRSHLPGYFEVYVDAPLSLVRARDAKGLYAKADKGEMPNVVGIDIPWHAPKHADVVIDASLPVSADESACAILRRIPGWQSRMSDST